MSAAIRRAEADVVLAEYGPTGVAVREACGLAGVPLVVHFHGYDASRHTVLDNFTVAYRQLFESCPAIVVVSRVMRDKLVSLGAPPEKLHVNPCGVDCSTFCDGTPGESPPHFLVVGRFVEKKAPYLALLAFAEAYRRRPDLRLTMIGDGPLLGPCRDLALGLGVDGAVTFLGSQPHDVVADAMRRVRGFVQHSIVATDGDCEGTPVAVLEAGGSGLPVIATRHAGIPDVVVDAETGYLVNEKDISGMAECIVRLADNPGLAARLGIAARARISQEFGMNTSIERLHQVLVRAAQPAGL